MVSVNEKVLIPTLETERLVLKKISINDAKDLYEDIYKNYDSYKLCYNRKFENFEDYFVHVLALLKRCNEKNYYRWGIFEKDSDRIIGEVLLNGNNQYNKYKIGYLISPSCRRIGYATEAVSKVVNFAFNEKKIPKIYAEITANNKASLKLVRKNGWRYEETRFASHKTKDCDDIKVYSLKNPKIFSK